MTLLLVIYAKIFICFISETQTSAKDTWKIFVCLTEQFGFSQVICHQA